jgi:hypothetical protein
MTSLLYLERGGESADEDQRVPAAGRDEGHLPLVMIGESTGEDSWP